MSSSLSSWIPVEKTRRRWSQRTPTKSLPPFRQRPNRGHGQSGKRSRTVFIQVKGGGCLNTSFWSWNSHKNKLHILYMYVYIYIYVYNLLICWEWFFSHLVLHHWGNLLDIFFGGLWSKSKWSQHRPSHVSELQHVHNPRDSSSCNQLEPVSSTVAEHS